jgi:hypothetical protein
MAFLLLGVPVGSAAARESPIKVRAKAAERVKRRRERAETKVIGNLFTKIRADAGKLVNIERREPE